MVRLSVPRLLCLLPLLGSVFLGLSRSAGAAEPPVRPNVLWISAEDFSPDMGCYGDPYAVTPNLDRLASQGVRFTRAFANSPVCAPSRSALITGMYCTSIGTQNMRCEGVPPPAVKCFPEYLRAAGYYCTNNAKTDYQFAPPVTAWDESSARAHWRNRPKGQPFFAVFNLNISHESQVRNRTPQMQRRLAALSPAERHDPQKAVVPPYYPDTPVVRKDWAQYYDVATLMDKEAGEILKQLEQDGLAEDTIVWFWGDHGRGLPRGKRWCYDSGLRVPLIVRVPEKLRRLANPRQPDTLKPGTVNGDLVSFVDFAPTMLSLTGIQRPAHLQGQSFLGSRIDPSRTYVYGNRDRMDEAYDLIRTARDSRYRYVRNFMPYLSRSQDIAYMNEMPAMQEMRRLFAEGKLTGPQLQYFRRVKSREELYDTMADPHEVRNLVRDPQHQDTLRRLRAACMTWMQDVRDIGFIPEPEFDEMKRPPGRVEKTGPPAVRVSEAGADEFLVTLTNATPGASMAYRTGGEQGREWKLYTEPVRLRRGQALVTKACRIGFLDSEEVRYEAGGTVPEVKRLTAGIHWSERSELRGWLERLAHLKRVDLQGQQALDEYARALQDPVASVRYWGVVGLHRAPKPPAAQAAAKTALAELLNDRAPVVRIAAARALCDWGGEAEAVPVLVNGLQATTDSARLHAAIALNQIGEKARPALDAIRARKTDSSEYVKRVVEATLRRFGG